MALMTMAPFLGRQAAPGEQSAQEGSGDQAGEESSSFVEANIEWEDIREGAMSTFQSFQDSFISWGSLWQLLAVLAALGLGYVGSRYPARRLRAWADE